MILGFSTQLNGKPTLFVEKILKYFLENETLNIENISEFIYNAGEKLNYMYADDILNVIDNQVKPKLHTIREDEKDRWAINNKIDFFINCRRKDMFRFAPVLPVVSIQSFEIKYHENTFMIYIDDKLFFFGNRDFTVNEFENYSGMMKLVSNDGFDTIEDFCTYFIEDFKGKIIHWTDLRY